jgi:hypothetical protein
MRQIMAFCAGDGPAGHARGFGMETDAKTIAHGGTPWYILLLPKRKMEIPV